MADYKHEEFTHFYNKKTGKMESFIKGGKEVLKEEVKRVEISFETISEISLDAHGEIAPYSSRSVVNVSRYVIDYWVPLIGGNVVMTYIRILEYTGDGDLCWKKVAELCEELKMSRPTFDNHIQTLEDFNFLIKFNRLNKLNNNKETSPLFKVRDSVPLLSEQLLSKLSPRLQLKHEKFMEKFGKNVEMNTFLFDSNCFVEDLIKGQREMVSKKRMRKVNEEMLEIEKVMKITNSLSNHEVESQEEIQNILKTTFHKGTYDMCVKHLFFINDDESDRYLIISKYEQEYIDIFLNNRWDEIYKVLSDVLDATKCKHVIYSYDEYIANKWKR